MAMAMPKRYLTYSGRSDKHKVQMCEAARRSGEFQCAMPSRATALQVRACEIPCGNVPS